MHTNVTHPQLIIWIAVMAGQLAVGCVAWHRRCVALAAYLGIELANSLTLFALAHLVSARAYYEAYCIATVVDYGAQVFLVAYFYSAIRKTGIPSKSHPIFLQVMAGTLLGVAILTVQFPLTNISHPEWRLALTADHTVFCWLCLLLSAAPLYAWVIDSAKDTRLVLTYLGIALYVAVRAGAVDMAISSHLVTRARHLPEVAYFASLILWCISCFTSSACHQWDPAQTELLKVALRERRSHLNELSRIERSHYT